MSTFGINSIVADADALIALLNKDDALHKKATAINEYCLKSGTVIIFPSTALLEAATAFQRKLQAHALAALIKKYYQADLFSVVYVDENIMKKAMKIYSPAGSKQNTIFDAIVAATADTIGADAIFSFDSWYKKRSYRLAVDLLTD